MGERIAQLRKARNMTQAQLADMTLELGKGMLLALHLGSLKDAGKLRPEPVSLGKLKKGEARRDALSEDLALAMGLLFKLLAPMRNVAGIETCARGIDAMAREEAAYWLGMAMHRKNPRRVLAALRLLLSAS